MTDKASIGGAENATGEFETEQKCLDWLHCSEKEEKLTNLIQADFQILDVIMTTDNRAFTIGPNTKDIFISPQDAFELYRKGKIAKKTVEFEGEQIFLGVE